MSIVRFVTWFSVRTRIVVLAIIPVVGFLVNGVAFTIGESEVSGAFDSVKQASALADSGQEFKDALAAMRISARDFATRPGEDRLQSFEDAYQHANMSLVAIDRAVPVSERQEILGLRARLLTVKTNFDNLVREQNTLGFTDEDGLRRAIRDAAMSV